jgi:hypothetical protein
MKPTSLTAGLLTLMYIEWIGRKEFFILSG